MNSPADSSDVKRALLLAATIAPFIFTFMTSSVIIAIPTIEKDLSLNIITQGWIVMSYILSSATFVVPLGRIADIYGRKKIFTLGIIMFTISSLFAGMADSAAILITCRVFQGIGGAMLAGTAIALLTTVFPANERGKVLGINVAAVYIGLAVGPVLGGILTQQLGWRSIFFLSAILGLLVLGVVLWKLKGEWTGAKGEKFDFAGSIIYILGLVALVYGFTRLPSMLGVGLVIGGAVGLAVFIRWELKSESPILDLSLFRNSRAFSFSNLTALINYSATFAISLLISDYLQYRPVQPFNAQEAGLILVAMPAMQAIFSPLAGQALGQD